MIVIYILIAILIAIVIFFGLFYLFISFPLRPKEPGFEYVYVEDDGTVRELYDDEIEYLKTEFLPADRGRPYIKSRYSSLTPVGEIGGYIPRRRVPRRFKIISLKKKPDTIGEPKAKG